LKCINRNELTNYNPTAPQLSRVMHLCNIDIHTPYRAITV